MLEKINQSFINLFEDRLFPCAIHRDSTEKKQVQLPSGWTDATKEYEDFNNSYTNSIALRTGQGITVINIDTKDLLLLEPYMSNLVGKWLTDKATFTVETTNGYHFYFDNDDKYFSNAVRVSNFVDIRGDGGCVFCYTEDEKSDYTVTCIQEPLPLTDEIMEYISLKERDAKVLEYNYDDTNRRITATAHDYNKKMGVGIDTENLVTIIESAGFIVTDFENTDGLYSRLHKLAFILAMNPACPNDFVRPIIEGIVKEYCGFNVDSDESQKRLYQMFSNMIYSSEEKIEEDLCTILKKYSEEIVSTLEILHKDLLFIKNGVNLVVGESKSGKTFTTIKSLVDCGFNKNIIHIDFDRNKDSKLLALGVDTYHISNAEGLIYHLENTQALKETKEKIIILDSLQDLSLNDGLDSNSGALAMMNRVLLFLKTNATLIVIHHVTQSGDTLKVKGNASTISSKSDVMIGFEKHDALTRSLTVLHSRAEDILATGKSITYNGLHLQQGVKFEAPK